FSTEINVIFAPKPVAANVPHELEIARVDNVVGAIRAVATAELLPTSHVAGPESAEVPAAESAPGELAADEKTDPAGLHALWRFRRGEGTCRQRAGHTGSIGPASECG